MKAIPVVVFLSLVQILGSFARGLVSRLGLEARAWILPLFFFSRSIPHKLFNNGTELYSGHDGLTTLECKVEEHTSRRLY